jgi:hypothetical protein
VGGPFSFVSAVGSAGVSSFFSFGSAGISVSGSFGAGFDVARLELVVGRDAGFGLGSALFFGSALFLGAGAGFVAAPALG